MDDHLPQLPHTFTWKRAARLFLILGAFALFFFVAGRPFLRLPTDDLPNGVERTTYVGFGGFRKLYYNNSDPKPPLIILLRSSEYKTGFLNRGVRYEVHNGD